MKTVCDKLVKRIKERYLYLIALCVFFVVAICINDPFDIRKGNYYLEQHGETGTTTIGDIVEGNIVEQHFYASSDGLQGVQLYFATYGDRRNDSVYRLQVKEEEQTVFEKIISAEEFEDNSYYTFDFPKQMDSEGKEYIILFECIEGENDNCVSLWINNLNEETGEKVTVNGEEVDGSLIFRVNYYKSYQALKIVFWIILFVISLLFVLFFHKADEKCFLQIALGMAIFIIILNPFVHAIDESTHFFRSFCISQGDFYDDIYNGEIGANVSSNYSEIVEKELSVKSFIEDPENWLQDFSQEEGFYSNPYMSSVVPINHAIAAVGVLIGRVLSLNALGVIILGRLANYLFYVVVCYFAIKNMRYYKTLFFVIATLPMSMWLAASYSADPVLLATSLLFVSICLKYKFSDEYTKIALKDIFLLFFCGVSICSVKYLIYTPILLFFFFIPRRLFRPRQYIGVVLGAVAVVVLMAVWQIYMLEAFPFKEDRNGYVDVAEQLKFIIGHIPYTVSNFVNYFVNSIFDHLQAFHYQVAIEELGKSAGIFAVLGACLEQKKYHFKNRQEKQKIAFVCALIVVVSYGLTIVALYLGFTPVGLKDVQGLQTRYWLPILFPLMLLVSMLPFENKLRHYDKYVAFFMGLGIINTLAGSLLYVFK